VAAVLVVGPASSSQATITRTATVARGVVQSTVSGSGNLQSVSQLDLGFKTGGTVTNIYVKQGQQVAQRQLLATLDPQSAEVTLEQAKASLLSAEASLAKEEETDGEGSTGTGGSGASAGATASTASVVNADEVPAATSAAASIEAAAAPTGKRPGTSTSPGTSPNQARNSQLGSGNASTSKAPASSISRRTDQIHRPTRRGALRRLTLHCRPSRSLRATLGAFQGLWILTPHFPGADIHDSLS